MLLLIRKTYASMRTIMIIFTFHYASTYTIGIDENAVSTTGFTFHYASTYTMPVIYTIYFALYLHSTMLLLILVRLATSPHVWYIYIPLCFYLYQFPYTVALQQIYNLHSTMLLLILCQQLNGNSPNTFTFHYASTYTDRKSEGMHDGLIYIPLCFYLYWGGLLPIKSTNSIYIPLCFYLYLCTIAQMIPVGHHLHSTMLLLIQLPLARLL